MGANRLPLYTSQKRQNYTMQNTKDFIITAYQITLLGHSLSNENTSVENLSCSSLIIIKILQEC
jgi:hypothetical protein